MFLYNGKKPGGYSIESYEPTDITPEEKNQANDFIKMAFTKKLYPRRNNSIDIPKMYNYNNSLYNNINNLTFSKNVPNISKIHTVNPVHSFQLNPINSINPYQTITSFNRNPIIYQYSNKPKFTIQPNKTIINYGNQNNIQNIKYANANIYQPIHRSNTLTFIPAIKQNPIVNQYAINTSQLVMPTNVGQPQIGIVPKYNLNINRILPIYPAITYRRRIIY